MAGVDHGTNAVLDDTALLVGTLKKVASALARSGVRYALTGGFAAYARGGLLSQHDVDFLVHEKDVETAREALRQSGFSVEDALEDWLLKAFDEDRMVDLIYRPVREPVTEAVLEDSEELCIDGAYMPVMSATVLMIHKLRAFTPHACDFATALPLARALREQVDWKRVSELSDASPYASAFLYLLTRLEIVDLPIRER